MLCRDPTLLTAEFMRERGAQFVAQIDLVSRPAAVASDRMCGHEHEAVPGVGEMRDMPR